jgi:hypothetical protein
MAKSYRRSKGKWIKPSFFVFCEGESEESYISFIRSTYRVPVQIVSKISGDRINQKYINNTLKQFVKHEKDKLFLLYDIDTPGMLERLQEVRNSILLASNPCFELWYILHFCNHTAEITTIDCIRKLERLCKDYKKGVINDRLRGQLMTYTDNATERAARCTLYSNPSTTVYFLLNEIKKL